jgi:hypothetical protein
MTSEIKVGHFVRNTLSKNEYLVRRFFKAGDELYYKFCNSNYHKAYDDGFLLYNLKLQNNAIVELKYSDLLEIDEYEGDRYFFVRNTKHSEKTNLFIPFQDEYIFESDVSYKEARRNDNNIALYMPVIGDYWWWHNYDLELDVSMDGVQSKKDYPHICSKCGSPSFNNLISTDCSNPNCR